MRIELQVLWKFHILLALPQTHYFSKSTPFKIAAAIALPIVFLDTIGREWAGLHCNSHCGGRHLTTMKIIF